MKSAPRRSESLAKSVIEASLPGVSIKYHDDGSSESAYDFNIVFPDGHVEALEVTESTQQDRRDLRGALRGSEPIDGGTALSWEFALNVDVKVKDVRPAIGPLALQLEVSGTLGPFVHRSSMHYWDPTIAALLGLGVDTFYSWAPRDGQPARIFLQMPGDGGIVSPAVVETALLTEAVKPDNLRKLNLADADERHLFVWVDSGDQFIVWRAMQNAQTPISVTALPSPITCAWIACGGPSAVVCWRIRPPAPWEILDPLELE